MQFVKNSDVFVAGHYYGSGSPFLFTRKDVKSIYFDLSVVADVSCDIDGPVATTIRPSSISNPIIKRFFSKAAIILIAIKTKIISTYF